MSDGTRTRDHLDHNQVLYQLSYTHHGCLGQPQKCTRKRGLLSAAGQAGSAPTGASGVSGGWPYRAAMARDVVVSGPGGGTKIASR